MRPFQIILLGIFGAMALAGLLFFATFRGLGGPEDPVKAGVTIWGTLDQAAFQEVLQVMASDEDRWGSVSYVRQDPSSFAGNLVNSIAEGRGPDLVVLPADLLISQAAKIEPISYDAYSMRSYQDTFIDGAGIFALPAGIYALPLGVDPLVMYWNRTMHASAGIAYPPRTWEMLLDPSQRYTNLTMRTNANDVTKSAIAFGEYTNIQNAKAAILMLLLQAGSKIVEITESSFVAELNASIGKTSSPPGDNALRFYSRFSNPTQGVYSWNRALDRDRDMFLSEDLALYFGFGSEYRSIRDGNANLSFDVAMVPQAGESAVKKTYGTFYGFAIPKTAKNQLGAYETAKALSLGAPALELTRRIGIAPARRDLIAQGTGDPVNAVLYESALIAHGWLDPNPDESSAAFADMVDAITSGRLNINEAIDNASYKIQQAF